MKYVLFFVALLLVQLSGIQCHKPLIDECAKELGITQDMLHEGPAKNHDKPEFRCFHACILKKKGILEAENKINMEKLKEMSAKHAGDKADEVFKAYEECVNEAKANTDECDFMNNVQDCFMKKNVWKAPGFH